MSSPCLGQIAICSYTTTGINDVCDSDDVIITNVITYEGVSKSHTYIGIIPVYRITFTSDRVPSTYSLSCSYIKDGIRSSINTCRTQINRILYYHISSECSWKCGSSVKDPIMFNYIAFTDDIHHYSMTNILYNYSNTNIYVLYLPCLPSIHIIDITSLFIS